MHFHHRDPSLKLFEINAQNMRAYSWDKVANEIKKCDLLCSNCHGEEEERLDRQRFFLAHPNLADEVKGLTKWSEVLAVIGRSSKRKRFDAKVSCKLCHKEFVTRCGQMYCSKSCWTEASRKVPVPPKEELEKYRKEGMSWNRIGNKYGVSRTAVKRWIIQYGIVPTSRSAPEEVNGAAQAGPEGETSDRVE
jgi:hypothetical protein